MKRLCLTACLLLGLAQAAPAAATKDGLVRFYQDYLGLVSASDYVATSRDHPEAWEGKFNAIARSAGFEDAADALAISETMKDDKDIATLRQAVADKILLQYKPYRE